MSNATTIAQMLAGYGYSTTAINGILGNLEIESNDNPGALNAKEGAIGIAQWEGGRRTNLQAYAARRGTSETDLRTQVEFLAQELAGMPNTQAALNHASDAGAAAAIFDAQFERSAGTSRQARVDAANSYAAGKGGAGVTTNSAGSASLGAAPAGLSAQDYQSALGTLGGLITTVPELSNILHQAVSGSWTEAKFQQAVQTSTWYRAHSDTARQALALQVADPATYKQQLNSKVGQVHQMMASLGVTLRGYQPDLALAKQAILAGWSDQQLQTAIGAQYYTGQQRVGFANAHGQGAQLEQQLKQMAQQYGQTWGSNQFAFRAGEILAGRQTVDSYKQTLINQAKAMYPGLIDQIDKGLTVADVAGPYQQSMANLLEVDPNALGTNDPLIRKALQGTTTTAGGKATSTLTPVWQFEEQLRNDPRWAQTQNAKDTMSTALLHIGADLGFGPHG